VKALSAVLLVVPFFSLPLRAAEVSLSRTNVLQFVANGKVLPIRTVDDWQKRRLAIREAMQRVMGPLPGKEKRCPLEVRFEEQTDCGDYVRHWISYASEPSARVPAYLLVPKTALAGKARFPAVLALHQTHPLGQKVVVGLGNSTNDEYGVRLVKRGFVVLAPPYPLLADYNPDLKTLGYESGTMKAIWDNIRAIDLLESLPYVRTNAFGAIGHSLGGHNGIYTAAFDERIKVVVSSCGFDAFRDYKNGDIRGWTSTRYMPRLLDYSRETRPFDFAEVIASLAPRWFFVNAPLGDSNFKWQSVDDVCAEARKVYQLYGASDRVRVEHPDSAHSFPMALQRQAFELLEQALR
jgi:dienelactone hydrolase